jgi:Flp pilus assembly protein TadB
LIALVVRKQSETGARRLLALQSRLAHSTGGWRVDAASVTMPRGCAVYVFVWGRNLRWSSLGRVARVCVVCGATQIHEVLALDSEAHIYFVHTGDTARVGYFTSCAKCGLVRLATAPLGAVAAHGTALEALKKAAPEATGTEEAALSSLRAAAAAPSGGEARVELVRQLLTSLDETWQPVPSRDARAKRLMFSVLLAPLAFLLLIPFAPLHWAGPILVITISSVAVLVPLATWARLTARTRSMRAHFVPIVRRALAKIGLVEGDGEQGLEAARAQGSRVARALRVSDLCQNRSAPPSNARR